MELLQEDFDTLYAKARATKPSARQIRIGLLRVPGTDPAIDRAIEARLVEWGFQIVPLGEDFLKAWQLAQRNGNLIAAASWYNNQALPIPLSGERFPVTSIQLIGPPKSEAGLLNIGRLVETKN